MQYVTSGQQRSLSHWTARVSGESAAAAVLRWHLGTLGVRVESTGRRASGYAATAELTSFSGLRREIVVEWGGPVAGVVDEVTAQARCGIMAVHGRRDGAPRGLEIDYCATAAGVLATTGLLATLAADRRRDVRLRTSVAQAALLTVSQYLASAGAEEDETVPLDPGGPPFISADGVAFEVETLSGEPWSRFWEQLGTGSATVRRSWRPFQFRYATATAPIGRELHELAAKHSYTDIAAFAAAAGVEVCRLRSAAEGAEALGLAETTSWPSPWRLFSRESNGRTSSGSGTSGASTQRPLEGLTVLEAGRRVQAPLAAHVLDLLGAHTTRIEPPGGDPLRGMPPACGGLSARWLALNRHKEAVELDIKSTSDQQHVRHLSVDADVFLHNWAPGKAEQLGLAAKDLPEHLVYAYTSALGDWNLPQAPIGTDFMVQARSGIGDLVRSPDEAPGPSLMTLLDVLGGLMGAEAVVAGLAQRADSGRGVEAVSSLLGAATTLHLSHLSAGRNRPPDGFRVPRRTNGGWSVRPDKPAAGDPVAVTTDLGTLLDNSGFSDVLTRDSYGSPAVRTPWRFS